MIAVADRRLCLLVAFVLGAALFWAWTYVYLGWLLNLSPPALQAFSHLGTAGRDYQAFFFDLFDVLVGAVSGFAGGLILGRLLPKKPLAVWLSFLLGYLVSAWAHHFFAVDSIGLPYFAWTIWFWSFVLFVLPGQLVVARVYPAT
jgi:hypothetical protein